MFRGVVVGVALVGLSCGGGAAALFFIPSVPGSAQFDELSDSQAMALCTSVRDYAKAQLDRASFRDLTCRAFVLFSLSVVQDPLTDANAQSACEGHYMICQSRLANTNGSPLGGELPQDSFNGSVTTPCSPTRRSSPDCTATVDQYAACINERYALTASSYPPCSAFTPAAVEKFRAHDGAYPGLDDGPACEAFLKACPSYYVQSTVPI